MLIQNLFETILVERHIDIIKALMPYQNDDNVFISFTDDVGEASHRTAGSRKTIGRNVSGAKLGINPKSPYDTPVGIYSYPLKLIWPRMIKNTIPFASDRAFLQLFRGRGNIINLTTMTSDEYEAYAERLRDKFDGSFDYPANAQGWSNFKHSIENVISRVRTPGGFFWSMTYRIAGAMGGNPRRSAIKWNHMMRQIGVDGCVDEGEGIIHINEPTQAVFFSIQSVALVETLPNVRKLASPIATQRTFKSMESLMQWLEASDEEAAGASKMIAAELPALLTKGESKNFRLADGALDKMNRPEDFIAMMVYWRGAKGIIPALDLMRTPRFSTPECANALLEGLVHGRKGNDALRLMSTKSAGVLAQALGKSRRETMVWIADKVATKAIVEFAFMNPIEGSTIDEIMIILRDEVGGDKATIIRSALGDARLMEITKIAAANFPY